MPAWEYHTARGNEDLERLGREGWELVSVIMPPGESRPLLYFKRPVESFRDRVSRYQIEHFFSGQKPAPTVESQP